jgi:hypothetical protein
MRKAMLVPHRRLLDYRGCQLGEWGRPAPGAAQAAALYLGDKRSCFRGSDTYKQRLPLVQVSNRRIK